MAPLNWYDEDEGFSGTIGDTAATSSPAWPRTPTAPAGAPNVVVVVLDDTGFAQLGCYGGLGGRIETPNIDALADAGLRYNNWHTTALCSPTRACLLTGRNHHSVGVGNIMEFATGYPGYNAQIPKSTAMLPALLVERGYNTMALGKWHLAPDEHISAAGPYERWPIGQGFERFYGFLPGENDQWFPDLWYDNHRVEPPSSPEEGYHLSEDLVDKAIEFINDQQSVTPDKPFFTYLAFGAHHSPHHAPKEYVDRYQGRFDAGWDVIHAETLAEQIRLGVVPAGTVLPSRNPGVRAWDELSETERRVLCRQMEVYAGFVSQTDDQVARLVEHLRVTGALDNTLLLVLSDNGASGEGGPIGLSSEMSYFNMVEETIDDMVAVLDRWGEPGTHPHYATGWAMVGNTPQRWYKQQVHEGGTRDPFIVHWPARVTDAGAVRHQFHHAIDVVPTVLDLLGVDPPASVRGHPQRPIEGVTMVPTFFAADAPTPSRSQYFEIFGHRAVWRDGWKAVTFHWTKYLNALYGNEGPAHDMDFDADDWELFDLDHDFSETTDLAAARPEMLREMIDVWWQEARRHQVLPLDDSNAARLQVPKPVVFTPRERYVYRAPVKLVRPASPDVRRRSHVLSAEIEVGGEQGSGVIVSNGSPAGGYTLYLAEGRVTYLSNYLGREHFTIRDEQALSPGKHRLRVEFAKTGDLSGRATLHVDDSVIGSVDVKRTNPAAYAVAEGLEVGSDGTAPVSPDYTSPAVFTGVIHEVVIEVGSDQVVDHETEARVANFRQ